MAELETDSPDLAGQPNFDLYFPSRAPNGRISVRYEEYQQQLNGFRRKEPLRGAAESLGLSIPKSANLDRIRATLINHWYPNSNHRVIATNSRTPTNTPNTNEDNSDDESLVEYFAVDGAAAEEVLGYDDDELDDDQEEDSDPEEDDQEEDVGSGSDRDFEDFQRRLRVEETRRAEGNRRPGGIRTQKAMVKAWKEFVATALEKGELKDDIIDQHHLILFIKYCAERPKRNQKGLDIPGTFIGASQIKKLYFGALRIRKEQDAEDFSLARNRPATSVHVWDTLKSRMNEALNRTRNGIVPGEDAPDIIANTFLAGVTDKQMSDVGIGFLSHRELRCVINGHLCWTAQNASGNRGDDFRALKLCELQPYTLLHPNKETAIESVLGLQGEEKAGAYRGMRTKINPVYSAFIAHRDPEKCPLGSFAFYHHYIHDVLDITQQLEINWSINKSWRQVRVLHGQKSPMTPYHEQSLYNLYVKSFAHAGFTSAIKAHLPRHILGYQQEKLGVDAQHTSKLGWVRGETYFDTYAPSLPKQAILGAHGYKEHEVYDPIWRHVHVPEQFLQLVCPMAENIHEQIVGRENLSGAANYWLMVMGLRPYLFQCGAAIFQICPKSALFRLPALAHPDVQAWMKTGFPTSYTLLKAKESSPIDLQRVQNEILRSALQNMTSLLSAQGLEIASLREMVERRTNVLSPTKAFSNETYQRSFNNSASTAVPLMSNKFIFGSSEGSSIDDTGIYVSEDDGALRAFANGSPKTPTTPRAKTQVDLILPPVAAFSKDGEPQLLWPPILGQRSVTWEQVFPLINPERAALLWECWGPNSLDSYTLDKQWACYSVGEPVFNLADVQIGIKPPLCKVEQYFKSKWRKKPSARKAWERFREIPEYIESEARKHEVSPHTVLDELDLLCAPAAGGSKRMGLSALTKIMKDMRFAKAPAVQVINPVVDEPQGSTSKRQPARDPRKREKKKKD